MRPGVRVAGRVATLHRVEPIFFATPEAWRAWLEKHHADATEVIVGFYKRASGITSITWAEAVDEALCFGWIDGVRRRIDEERYTNRFTPRTPTSTWSAVNIARVKQLRKEGRMRPEGLAAFQSRSDERSAIYAYEQRQEAKLDAGSERRFRSNRDAWRFWESQPPWYRRTAAWWVISAKRPETRERRLAQLIEDSADRRRIRRLIPPAKR
jgi:uncharacterized protein YdeI (YjbR/CyaY-like superfamily)